jgi:hypothetical protein
MTIVCVAMSLSTLVELAAQESAAGREFGGRLGLWLDEQRADERLAHRTGRLELRVEHCQEQQGRRSLHSDGLAKLYQARLRHCSVSRRMCICLLLLLSSFVVGLTVLRVFRTRRLQALARNGPTQCAATIRPVSRSCATTSLLSITLASLAGNYIGQHPLESKSQCACARSAREEEDAWGIEAAPVCVPGEVVSAEGSDEATPTTTCECPGDGVALADGTCLAPVVPDACNDVAPLACPDGSEIYPQPPQCAAPRCADDDAASPLARSLAAATAALAAAAAVV